MFVNWSSLGLEILQHIGSGKALSYPIITIRNYIKSNLWAIKMKEYTFYSFYNMKLVLKSYILD